MTRLVAEHFNPRGRPKKRFASEADAKDFKIRRRMKRHRAYRCTVCGAWHLGAK